MSRTRPGPGQVVADTLKLDMRVPVKRSQKPSAPTTSEEQVDEAAQHMQEKSGNAKIALANFLTPCDVPITSTVV